jgi:uncharacterized protein
MNKVVHFEIPADNIERAQKFYKELFGWNIEKAGEMPYWIARSGECDENNIPKEAGFINGGMMKRDSEQDPSGTKPVIVIKVEDLDEHLKKIEEAGGKVAMSAIDVGDMGRYARVEDTENNIIGIWQDKK